MSPRQRGGGFIERARREQLVAVTIDQIAERGLAATTLAGIADAAGLSKAAVLYHFPSKAAVLAAAFETVSQGLVARVGGAMSAAPDAAASVDAYVRELVGYLVDHPRHAAALAAAVAADVPDGRAERWRPLGDAIARAQAEGVYRAFDPKVAAVALGGAIDALVAQRMLEPGFDLAGAGKALLAGWNSLARGAGEDGPARRPN